MTTARAILDMLGFQIVWLSSAIGASYGDWRPGALAALVLITLQAAAPAQRRATWRAAAAAGLAGLIGETALIQAGLVSYAAAGPIAGVAPLWLIGLWAAIGTTMRASLHLLGTAPLIKAAIAGAISAPIAYATGANLGALAITQPTWLGYLAIGALWAVAFPMLIGLHRSVLGKPT